MATNSQTSERDVLPAYPPEIGPVGEKSHPTYPKEVEPDQQGIHTYAEWWVTVDTDQAGAKPTLHLPKPGSTRGNIEKCCKRYFSTSLREHDIAVFPPDSDGNQYHDVCLDCLAFVAGNTKAGLPF